MHPLAIIRPKGSLRLSCGGWAVGPPTAVSKEQQAYVLATRAKGNCPSQHIATTPTLTASAPPSCPTGPCCSLVGIVQLHRAKLASMRPRLCTLSESTATEVALRSGHVWSLAQLHRCSCARACRDVRFFFSQIHLNAHYDRCRGGGWTPSPRPRQLDKASGVARLPLRRRVRPSKVLLGRLLALYTYLVCISHTCVPPLFLILGCTITLGVLYCRAHLLPSCRQFKTAKNLAH
jgi:hypothetical protein